MLLLCIQLIQMKYNPISIQQHSMDSRKPSADIRQNYVIIGSLKKLYDVYEDFEACVSCEQVFRSAVFTLRGVCKYSFLDTEYFATICGGFIGFMAQEISIW